MPQMNPKEVFHNTAYSIQLPYIAGHSLETYKMYILAKKSLKLYVTLHIYMYIYKLKRIKTL